MAIYKDQGIVLRRLDYSETSQVLLVFCRDGGMQRLIGKGIKRGTKTRVAVGVDLLEWGHVAYSRREGGEARLGTLTEWQQIDLFDAVRKSLPAWYAAQYAAEATAALTEEADPHPGLFAALARLLTEIADDPPARLVGYLLVLLREVGLTPQWSACAACGRPPETGQAVYFSARLGGIVCRDCEPACVEKRRVGMSAAALLERESPGDEGGKSPGAPVSAAAVAGTKETRAVEDRSRQWYEPFDLVDYYLRETSGRPLRVAGALRAALNWPRRD